MRKDGFLRCYLEALALWIGGNVLLAIAVSVAESIGWKSNPLDQTFGDRVAQVFDPFFLLASGIICVPLFAAILVGSRRTTGARID